MNWLKTYDEDQPWYELEALRPTVLQRIVRDLIDSLIDRRLYNAEVRKMKEENQYLEGLRRTVTNLLRTSN